MINLVGSIFVANTGSYPIQNLNQSPEINRLPFCPHDRLKPDLRSVTIFIMI